MVHVAVAVEQIPLKCSTRTLHTGASYQDSEYYSQTITEVVRTTAKV